MKRYATIVEIAALVAVPIVMAICACMKVEQTAVLTFMVTVAALLTFFVGFERSQPTLRQLMPVAVLSACAVAGRIFFAPFPSVKPVSAICIVAGVVFGRRCGFMVGALAALVSNFFFGQGPFTPWQMYAWGLIGYLSGVLAQTGLHEKRGAVLAWGAIAALMYGFILNTWTLFGYVQPDSVAAALAVYGAGLALDVVHAVSTVVFLLVIYTPWRRKLERIKRKYAFN